LTLAGCVVGPKFKPPAPPAIDHYLPTGAPDASPPASLYGVSQRLEPGAALGPRWWSRFNSPALNKLESQALDHNPTLEAAQATLRQAHELYLAQRASRFPTLQASAAGQRVKNADVLASPLSSNAQTYSLYSAQFDIAYVIDVFGGQRRQIEAAAAQQDVQRFQLQAAYLALTTNVASTVLQIAGLRSQLSAAHAVARDDQRLFETQARMQARGEASSADVAAARAVWEQAEQAPPGLDRQIDLLNDQLAVLAGVSPAELKAQSIALSDVQLPAELPLSLPSELVRQRPDVRMAEATLHVASAQVGVATAARLPSFNLNGTLGGDSTALGTLLSGDNILWSIGGSASQVVFDAGALRHQQRAAEAALAAAQAQYRAAVLAAFQSTADALQAIARDGETLNHVALARQANAKSAEIARAQFEHGQSSILAALSAEAADHQAEQSLQQAQAARYADTVALFQALGGGWWPQSDESQAGRGP
jgi:NodT family efflux transporter outer membrane factor (OMF) lipoprotein